MSKSGLADSPFFMTPQKPIEAVTPPSPEPPVQKAPAEKVKETKAKKLEQPSNRDTTTPRYQDSMISSNNASMQASNNASIQASMQSSNQESIVEAIRKVVKDVGKGSATYRFTPEEKKALLELSFSYKMQGYKTTENELIRIALNFLLEDQRQNGRNSVLQRVLDALNK